MVHGLKPFEKKKMVKRFRPRNEKGTGETKMFKATEEGETGKIKGPVFCKPGLKNE